MFDHPSNSCNQCFTSVTDLELSVRSHLLNDCLSFIGAGRLINMKNVHIHLFDEEDPAPDILANSIYALFCGCPLLMTFQCTDGLVGFTDQAFLMLGRFTRLRKIVCLYDQSIVSKLQTVLQDSKSLEQVIFFENASYCGNTKWIEMEDELENVRSQYPSVQVSLMDWWWSQ